MKMFIKLTIANFKEMFRDKMQIFWFLLFPIVFVLIFGVLFSNIGKKSPSGVPENVSFDIGVASKEEAPLTEPVKERFCGIIKMAGIFKVHSSSRAEETEAFKKGKRHALLLIPPDFIEKVQQKAPVTIDLLYDATHLEVLFAVSEMVNAIEKTIRGEMKLVQFNLISSIELKQKLANHTSEGGEKKSNAALNQIDFVLPGILALTLMQLGLFSSLRIVNLRTQKTLKSLSTTPMPRTTFLAGEITIRLILSLVQGIIIVLVGHYVFNLTVSSSWIAIIGWIILGISCFIALGYMLTTFVKTPESGNALMQVVQFPMMFLAGIFVPQEMMPEFMRPVVHFMPLAYLADALRSSLTGITSIYGTFVNVLVLTGILIVSLVVTMVRFSWE